MHLADRHCGAGAGEQNEKKVVQLNIAVSLEQANQSFLFWISGGLGTVIRNRQQVYSGLRLWKTYFLFLADSNKKNHDKKFYRDFFYRLIELNNTIIENIC